MAPRLVVRVLRRCCLDRPHGVRMSNKRRGVARLGCALRQLPAVYALCPGSPHTIPAPHGPTGYSSTATDPSRAPPAARSAQRAGHSTAIMLCSCRRLLRRCAGPAGALRAGEFRSVAGGTVPGGTVRGGYGVGDPEHRHHGGQLGGGAAQRDPTSLFDILTHASIQATPPQTRTTNEAHGISRFSRNSVRPAYPEYRLSSRAVS